MSGRVQAPEKELRFTRSAQAIPFWIASAVLTGASIILIASAFYRDINPFLPHPAWALIPAATAFLAFRTAAFLTRHAYLILTPLGIEIFPLIRPSRGMRLVTWQEIAAAEVNASITRLTLHHDAARTSGIHLSLRPISPDRRLLLAKAVTGRLSPGEATAPQP